MMAEMGDGTEVVVATPHDSHARIRIAELEQQVARLTEVLGTLLSWMGQSAASPLSRKEIETLIRRVEDAE